MYLEGFIGGEGDHTQASTLWDQKERRLRHASSPHPQLNIALELQLFGRKWQNTLHRDLPMGIGGSESHHRAGGPLQ